MSETAIQERTEAHFASPFVDLYEDQDSFLLIADLPGVDKEDLEIRLHDDELTIEGRSSASEVEGELLMGEFQPRHFRRTFTLYEKVDVDNIAAEMKDGVLNIRLPKSPDLKVRQIAIH